MGSQLRVLGCHRYAPVLPHTIPATLTITIHKELILMVCSPSGSNSLTARADRIGPPTVIIQTTDTRLAGILLTFTFILAVQIRDLIGMVAAHLVILSTEVILHFLIGTETERLPITAELVTIIPLAI